jgi:fructose-specific phosphotransferase system IIA component
MNISDIFSEDFILLNTDINSKNELFQSAADHLYSKNAIKNKEIFIKALYERESIGETGVGDGFAIPHAKSDTVFKPVVLYIKNNKKIEYESLDDLPVDNFFMLAVPENSGNEHINLLSSVACLLLEDEFKAKLENVENKSEIVKLVNEYI